MYKYIDDKKQHLHTLDGKPLFGTSTVTKVLNKPALIQWAANMACDYIKTNGRDVDLDDLQGWVVSPEMLEEARYAHKKKKENAATAGTDMHAELEKYVRACMEAGAILPTANGSPKEVQFFGKWAQEKVKRFLWSEGYCYSRSLWVGGISDVGAEMMDGSYAIIDFKSAREAYEDYFIQCAGYKLLAEDSGIVTADGELVLKLDKPISQFIVIPFGAYKVDAVPRYNVDELADGFKACLTLHRIVNK